MRSTSETSVRQNENLTASRRSITPALPEWERHLLVSLLNSIGESETPYDVLIDVSRRWQSIDSMKKFCAVALVLADLVRQGWLVSTEVDQVYLTPSTHEPTIGETPAEAKDRVRKTLLLGRDRQLREPSVQAFVRRMESPAKPKKSIFSLISDGHTLASELQDALADSKDAVASLGKLIAPQIEVCDPSGVCGETGLKLLDIWRYFRHTWSLEYRPVPGRAMPILIRNNAQKNRPVMGIAMLASPVMKMRARDEWLGLSVDALAAYGAENPRQRLPILRSLQRSLKRSLDDIRHDDLISTDELSSKSRDVIFRLERIAAGASAHRDAELRKRKEQGRSAARGNIGSKNLDDVDWRKASEDPLFVKKRAETLAKLIEADWSLSEVASGPQFEKGLRGGEIRRAAEVALKEYLKVVMASQAMDVSVCGAVAPYNDLLVGKLVALLMTSDEVASAYSARYSNQPSIIASQMAGRPIVKPSDLRVLTTTSLYGHSSSQYNRLKLLAANHGSISCDLNWREIAKTKGFGSIHLSSETVDALRTVSESHHGMRRINSRFGEGTNPRMRQIREGLEALGIPSDAVLEHATKRILYGFRADGNCDGSQPLILSKNTKRRANSRDIAAAWIERWLVGRVGNEVVMDRLREAGPKSVSSTFSSSSDGQFLLQI